MQLVNLNNFGNTGNHTRGWWVRSKYATSVLCSPPNDTMFSPWHQSFFIDKLQLSSQIELRYPWMSFQGHYTESKVWFGRKKEEEKAWHPAGIKPTTSLLWGVCSAAELQQLPKWRWTYFLPFLTLSLCWPIDGAASNIIIILFLNGDANNSHVHGSISWSTTLNREGEKPSEYCKLLLPTAGTYFCLSVME